MPLLPDGSYDVVVVDAETSEDGQVRIELTITLGPYIGHIIPLRERNIDDNGPVSGIDPLELLGVPGTLPACTTESRNFAPNGRDAAVDIRNLRTRRATESAHFVAVDAVTVVTVH